MVRVLINGLSVGGGGGYAVARGLTHALAHARPSWSVELQLIRDLPLHQEMGEETQPDNVQLLWAPNATTKRRARRTFEKRQLTQWCRQHQIDAVVQLNGMLGPDLPERTVCHFQDPLAYRPQVWQHLSDRLLAWARRREHRCALKRARCCSFTSHYLMDLICGHHGIRPTCCQVLYNGVDDAWLDRLRQPMDDLLARPMRLISVSQVSPYKRHDLVVSAMAKLVHEHGLTTLHYDIVGQCDPVFCRALGQQIESLNLREHVTIHGRVDQQTKEQAMARARCFVLMSECESFGLPAIEAMSFGTPVVTSGCCAMPEVCGNAAELVEPGRIDVLTEALHRVLTDSTVANHLRAQGLKQVARYPWRAAGDQLAGIIEAMV